MSTRTVTNVLGGTAALTLASGALFFAGTSDAGAADNHGCVTSSGPYTYDCHGSFTGNATVTTTDKNDTFVLYDWSNGKPHGVGVKVPIPHGKGPFTITVPALLCKPGQWDIYTGGDHFVAGHKFDSSKEGPCQTTTTTTPPTSTSSTNSTTATTTTSTTTTHPPTTTTTTTTTSSSPTGTSSSTTAPTASATPSSLAVVAPAPTSAPSDYLIPAVSAGVTEDLASTGSNAGWVSSIAVGLLLAGASTVLWVRRRRTP